MKRIKQVLAIIGVVLLVTIYIITLVSSLRDSPFAHSLFQASLFSTVAVPVFLYAVMLVYRLLKDRNTNSDINESEEDQDN